MNLFWSYDQIITKTKQQFFNFFFRNLADLYSLLYRIHKKLNLSYIALALPMAAFLCGGVAIIEWLWPTSKDLNSLNVSYIV